MSSEIKVGILFFLGLATLFVMTVIISDFSIFQSGYTFPVYFHSIGGLEKGNRVLFSGVNVGVVDSTEFTKETEFTKGNEVRVHLRIEDSQVFIPADSKVNIEQASMLAGMQVSIMAGKSTEDIRDVEHKMGEPPLSFTQAISEMALSAKDAIDDIREPLKKTIENISDISAGLEEGKGTLGLLLKDDSVYKKLDSTLEEAEKAVASINEIAGRIEKTEIIEDLSETVRDAKETMASVRKATEGEGIIARLLSDESGKLYSDIEDTAAGAKKFLDRLNTEDSTINKLLTSDDLYTDIKSISSDLKSITKKVDDVLHSKDSTIGKLFNEPDLYNKAEEFIDNIDETLGAMAKMKVFVHLSFFTSNHPYEEYRYQLNIKLWPYHEKRWYQRYFLVGGTITSVGDDAPLILTDPKYRRDGTYYAQPNFQFAYVFDLSPKSEKKKKEEREEEEKDHLYLGLRAGLLDGQVGGGLDLDFLRYFRFTVEGRSSHSDKEKFYESIEPFYCRAYFSTRVSKYFRVYIGGDNIVDQAVLSFGISLEWEDEDIKNIVGVTGPAF